MAGLLTTQVSHGREDLAEIINSVSPEETPLYTMLSKTKATNTRHETLTEALNAPNPDNALVENGSLDDTVMTTPKRIANYTQISSKVVNVSGTLQAINTAGSKDEFARQVRKAGVEIRRDIEASIVSANASASGATRKSAGMEAWISTNTSHGTGGSTTGYNGAITVAPTDGTTRVLTESMFKDGIQQAWVNNGNISHIIAPPALKQLISTFNGNATKFQQASDKTITAGIDVYVSDFGTHKVMPHRNIRTRTIIGFDPDLWALANLRNFQTKDLGKLADGDRKSLICEWTLEAKNELGNFKIADLKAA